MLNIRKTSFFAIIAFILFAAPFAAAAPPPAPRTAVLLGYYPAGADTPDPIQTWRVYEAWRLFASGTVDTIVVSGGYTRGHISEARMAKIALSVIGVPPDSIVEEDRSATTIENGAFSAKLFESRGWMKDVFLVSQKIHLVRADGIFKKDGFRVKDAPAPENSPGGSWYPPAPGTAPLGAASAPLIIVYEPYSGDAPLEFPSGAFARRLQAAAALCRANPAAHAALFSDWYTRGPADPAEVMKIALVTLGVAPTNITANSHVHNGNFYWLLKEYGKQNALLIVPPGTPWDGSKYPDVPWTAWRIQ